MLGRLEGGKEFMYLLFESMIPVAFILPVAFSFLLKLS